MSVALTSANCAVPFHRSLRSWITDIALAHHIVIDLCLFWQQLSVRLMASMFRARLSYDPCDLLIRKCTISLFDLNLDLQLRFTWPRYVLIPIKNWLVVGYCELEWRSGKSVEEVGTSWCNLIAHYLFIHRYLSQQPYYSFIFYITYNQETNLYYSNSNP